jgi:DNA-binding response OmpR family regulator
MRVLLVDDSKAFRDLLAEVATAAGLDVIATAASGEEGLRLFEELRPEALILDVRLPGMNGFEVAERIREMSEATRVVIVSATDTGRDPRIIPKRSLTPQRLRTELGSARVDVDKL